MICVYVKSAYDFPELSATGDQLIGSTHSSLVSKKGSKRRSTIATILLENRYINKIVRVVSNCYFYKRHRALFGLDVCNVIPK